MLASALDHLRQDVIEGAKALIGTHLVREDLRARIVEVEAYRTPDDPACHAHRGKTDRNRVMFGPPGFAYVYFNYGVHWMLNVTAHEPGNAAAVLIRAAKPLEGIGTIRLRRPKARREEELLSGPGKLAAAFGIGPTDYGLNLFDPKSPLRLEAGSPPDGIVAGPRIGLKVGTELPWRFVDAAAREWISRTAGKSTEPAANSG